MNKVDIIMDGLSTSAPYFHFQILDPEDEDPQLIGQGEQ